ncbi:MAG TPA: universal stress protein [Patescibacteria group bacterium]|nr:universal stress protein [Patescibacteria group bacterium]
MRKILVTTDLSENSKSGIHFAIQLASQLNCDLTFLHLYFISKPAYMTDIAFTEYEKEESQKLLDRFTDFVHDTFKSADITPRNISLILKCSFLTDSAIAEYATTGGFDYICIATHGAGKVRKILGTTTSYLIANSNVPVIVVPGNYKPVPITSILYASDLRNVEKELCRVKEFAEPLQSTIMLLHFTSPLDKLLDTKTLEKVQSTFPEVNVLLEDVSPIETLLSNLETTIEKTKPSLLVMFTDQDRSLFERIFLSSNSAEFSFAPKLPLLVFKKI